MRHVGKFLSWALIVCLFVLAGAILVPSLLGYKRYVITSGSMTGTIDKGSVAYNKVVSTGDLKVKDIITFKPPPEYNIDEPVTHRLVEISGEHGETIYRTKGDANKDIDPWRMTLDDGQVPRNEFHIPYLGYIYMALRQPWVMMLVIALPALLIAISVAVKLWRDAGKQAEQENAEAERAARIGPPRLAGGAE